MSDKMKPQEASWVATMAMEDEEAEFMYEI